MAALEMKGIPGLPTTLFLVSALSAVAYRHLVLAFLESICLQLPSLLAQNGATSTCMAGGSLVLIYAAANRCNRESSDFSLSIRILGPGHAFLLLGRFLQRPKMPSFEDFSSSTASWILVDLLTWTIKPGKASPTASAECSATDKPDCSQEHNRMICSNSGSGAVSVGPANEPQSTSTGKSMRRTACDTSRHSRRRRQGKSEAAARDATCEGKLSMRAKAPDVQIVRPGRPLRRAASCPEESARQLPAGCRAAAALRSHSLTPEAWEDLHSGSAASLRSHSLELHPDDNAPSGLLASHRIHLNFGSNHGSSADLAPLADAEGGCSVGLAAPDQDMPAGSAALARSASASSSMDDASFHDALDVQANDAVGCLGLDGDCPAAVRAACPEAFLLQFGALLNESSATKALRERGLPSALGGEGTCFGAPDEGHAFEGVSWEQICEEASSGVSYTAWRRPLRRGLYLYRTCAIIDGVAPADVRRFHLDDEARHDWDETLLELARFPGDNQRENCIISYRAKWPRPFSPREYVYGRRVWTCPADGGCYCVSADADGIALAPTAAAGRSVRVRDFSSCLLIRAAPGRPGATEMTAVYFEDPCVRPGIMNLGVRKALWPYLLKYIAALRDSLPASLCSPPHLECQGSTQAAGNRGGINRTRKCHEAGRRRSLARSQNRLSASSQKRHAGLGLFRRRSLLLTATILAVLF